MAKPSTKILVKKGLVVSDANLLFSFVAYCEYPFVQQQLSFLFPSKLL
jgi:hypothetical protein